jgi:DNA-directed RNA polymerase alpha subunit
MSNLLLPIWLEPRVIDEDDHEELKRLANGNIQFCFRDITKELIIKFYNKYPKESFYRLLRVLGFYGIIFTGKIASYSGPQEQYPEVMSIDRGHWEKKIILPEVLSNLVSPFRSFGLSKIKQLHGVPVQCVIALSGSNLSPEKISTYFHTTIIQVRDDFFAPKSEFFSCKIPNEISSDETLIQQQSSSTDWHSNTENIIDDYYDQRLSQSIEILQLSSESLANLLANNIYCIGELVAKNDKELATILKQEKNSLQEIKVRLWLIGLRTGLKVRTITRKPDPSAEDDNASIPIEILDLSVRSKNCLREANIKTISELLSKNDKELLSIPHFGRKCLYEIRSKLGKLQQPKKDSKVQQFSLEGTDQLDINSIQDEIFSDLKTKSSDLVLSLRARKFLKDNNIIYMWQLVQLTKIELFEFRNLGRKSINELDEVLKRFGFWFGMRFTPIQLDAILSFKPPPEQLVLSASIKQLVGKFSTPPFSFLNDRENLIVGERLFKVGKKKTLEELAIQFSLTRERVRQIEKSSMEKIKQHHLKELQAIVYNMKQQVEESSGLADLNVLGIDQVKFSEKEQNIASCLFQMVDEKLFFDWKSSLFSTRGEDWILSICDAIEEQINETVPEKFFTEKDLTVAVEKTCVDFGLSSDLCQQNLTKTFYLKKKVRVLDNLLCCGRVTKQDHIILAFKELFPDGLEVYKKQDLLIQKLKVYDQDRFGATSPKAILSRLTDHSDVFLWRRGFFIHKEHLNYDEEIVKKVVTWIEERFNQGHSRFQVDVPFNILKDDLQQAGIPTQYALYTLLRLQNNKRIGQRKFPTIVDLQADIDIQEGILEELESYFLQSRGAIPYLQVKEEFLVKRGWKVYSMQQNMTTLSEVIYPWHDNSYIHLDYITVNYAKLESLLDDIRVKLNSIQGAYSLKGAKKEMGVIWEQACPSASVRTMVKLIRSVDPEGLQIDGYFIQYADQLTESGSATLELEEFCLEKGVEVNSYELQEEFCNHRGWSESQYYPAIRKANLLRSGKSTYIHPVIINWDESLSLVVHQVMMAYIDARHKNHYPHMQIEELIYQYALPDLPQNIQWTRQLLKSVSTEFGDFLFFDDAYITIDNDFEIEDLDDMIGFLIGRHFRTGIAKRNEVEQMLWREGILESGKPIPADQYFNESSIVFLPESDEVGLSPNGIERYAQSI